jgi:hypothetical protein
MNFERAAMKGRLAEAKTNKIRLANKFEALAAAIRQGLNTALTDIEEIEIPQLSQMWSDLETAWAEILSARSDIERLEKELGD